MRANRLSKAPGFILDGFSAEHGLAQEAGRELHEAVVAERLAGNEGAEAVESVSRFIIGWLFSPSGKNRRLTMVNYLVVLWTAIDLENIFHTLLAPDTTGPDRASLALLRNFLILDGSENI